MNEPTGYTALDLIGYTDKGDYSAIATYVKNDLTNYGGTKWRCKIDDTTGVTPTEGVNWTVFVAIPADTTKQIIAPVEGATSLHAYVVGEQLIYNDTLYKVIAPIAVNDALVVNTNIEVSPKTVIEQVEDNTSEIDDLWDAQQTLGAWNLLETTLTTQVKDSVTWTANADGTVNANGTTSADSRITIGKANLSAGTYYLSGCATPPNTNDYRLRLSRTVGGVETVYWNDDATSITTVTVTPEYAGEWLLEVRYGNTKVMSDVLFKPMIAIKAGLPRVPHAMTNRKLTEDVAQSSADITSILSNSYFTLSGTGFIRKIGKLCEIYASIKCTANATVWTTILSSLPIPYNSKVAYQDYGISSGTGTNTTAHITSTGDLKLYGGQANSYYHVHFIYMTN